MTQEPNNLDVRLALEEMRLSIQQTFTAGDALDQKVNIVLITAGLLAGLASILDIPCAGQRSPWDWLFFVVPMALFVSCVLVALFSSRPNTYHAAVAAEWDELDKQIFGRTERDAVLSLLAGYVEQVQHNQKINRHKASLLFFCILALAVIVLVLFCRAIVS